MVTESAAVSHGQFLPGLIMREKEPENLEFLFSALQDFVTPVASFYVRNHFAAPVLDAETWQLTLEGAVEQPRSFSYAELLAMPAHTLTATLECAGNSRVFLTPKEKGVQWALGAVGNAEWTGVPLAALLAKVGIKPSAIEVVLEGADQGEIKEEPKSPGAISFARSLPIIKAQAPEVLVAYAMNGQPLSVAHGFPVRVIVPGWYGMASVKWLTRIVVTEQPFHGYFQSSEYTYWERRHGLPTAQPITAMAVKAVIAQPALHAVIPANQLIQIFGAAWTGEAAVTKVEISSDGGAQWQLTQLLDEPTPHAWRLWTYAWQTPSQPGPLTLLVRATDTAGRVQPMQHDPDCKSYMVNYVLPHRVEVQ